MFNVNGRLEKQYNYILTLSNDGPCVPGSGHSALYLHSWTQSFQQEMVFIIYIISGNTEATQPRIHFNFTELHSKPFH